MTESRLKLWEGIIEDVDKDQIPVSCLRRVQIKLIDGRRKTINIAKMRTQGHSNEEIEENLGIAFYQLHDDIKKVDFFVDTAAVANMVEPQTDRLLKNYFAN